MALTLTSSAFAPGTRLHPRFGGDGRDDSPPLSWTGAPQGTACFALLCEDPDAGRAQPWCHWVIYNIPVSAGGLDEGLRPWATLDKPPGARQGQNGWRQLGYKGPAPPRGSGVHRYVFRLFALDVALDVPGLDRAALLSAMPGHVLAEAVLMGTYQRA